MRLVVFNILRSDDHTGETCPHFAAGLKIGPLQIRRLPHKIEFLGLAKPQITTVTPQPIILHRQGTWDGVAKWAEYDSRTAWRGGRVVEGAPLLREYTGDGIEGSNPFLSATDFT